MTRIGHLVRRTRRSVPIWPIVIAFQLGVGLATGTVGLWFGHLLAVVLGIAVVGAAVPPFFCLSRSGLAEEPMGTATKRAARIRPTATSKDCDAFSHAIDDHKERRASGEVMVDLASIGRGDPGVLTAATLDRSVFPRLVSAMDVYPPTDPVALSKVEGGRDPLAATAHQPVVESMTVMNLLRMWRVAVRDEDLSTCRRLNSAFMETGDDELIDRLHRNTEELADRIERALRAEFADRARSRDFAGLLEVGRRIHALLPDRPIANEIQRLEPRLIRCLNRTVGVSRPANRDTGPSFRRSAGR